MKTYAYVSFGPRDGRKVETGRTYNNCDCIAAIGREPQDDEVVGVGRNKREAIQDALQHNTEGRCPYGYIEPGTWI